MKGYYKLKKIKKDTGELVLETDWIPNIITEFFLESRGHLSSSALRSLSISNVTGTIYDGQTGYWGSDDTSGYSISDNLRRGELISLFSNGFITITDESLVEGYGERAQLNATNPNTSIRMGKVISGVPEISSGLTWDDVNKNFYMSLTQQFSPPPSLFTVRTVCLAPNRNYGFEGDFWLYGDGINDNRTWTYTNLKNLTGITSNFPLYSYTTLSPEVAQDPTETLIVSYKIVFEPPAAGGITKTDWISLVSTMANGNRYYNVNYSWPGVEAEDNWLGGWPTPLELVGPASTTPLTGDQYNLWRRHFEDYDGYSRQAPTSSTNYNYDAIYHTNFINYTKNLTDSDLGRIRGSMGVGNTQRFSRSWSHLWYNLLPEGANQTQNYYAHSATKDKPFFEATNIANTTGTISIDSSSLSLKSLPELWRVNYGTTGIVGSSSYNVLTRKLSGTVNNSYDYRTENLFHPGYFGDSSNSSNLYSGGTYGGLDQLAGPYDRLIERLGYPTDVALYSRFYDVTLSDGRPAILQFYCRGDLGHSFITIYDPQTPEVVEIVDNTNYPSYDILNGSELIYDDISGDHYVFCQINGVFRIQNLLNVGSGIVITNFNNWSTTYEGTTVQNTITNPNPALDDFFGAKVVSNQTYTAVSNDTINGSGAFGYVYIYNNSTGALTYTLQDPTSPSTDTAFGFSISLSPKNNVLVVGAPNKSTGSGKVYVYDLDSSPLTPQSTISNQNTIGTPDNDNFGYSVAVMSDGVYDFLVVGAPGEDSALNTQNGVAYVYDLQNLITPTLSYTIINPDNSTANDDKFGTVVAINDNNKVIIGSPNEPNSLNEGSVYVYNSPSGNFNDLTNTATLTNPSGSPAGNYFGYSLAVSTNYLYVGSPFDEEGKVYKYTLSNNSLANTFQAPTPQAGGEFGKSVAIDFSENRYIIGEPGQQKAYIYQASNDSLEETITNPGATSPSTDRFSDSVAIQPNVVSIGAPGEDGASNQQGVLYLYAPGVNGLSDVAVNPSNRTYALTLGKPISGTHRTLWGIIQGALVKSVDQGATWEGYDSTSTGGVTFTNSVVENLWGRVIVFKCDPNDDRLFIIAISDTGTGINQSSIYYDTYAYWWDPINDTTSIGEIYLQAYGGKSIVGLKGSNNFYHYSSEYNQFYPHFVTFWSNFFGCTSEGLWWGAHGSLTSYNLNNNSTTTGDPWARPWTASYQDLTLTHMTNVGNTSRTGLESVGTSYDGWDSQVNSYTLGVYYPTEGNAYYRGRSWEVPIEFTRIDGVKGLIKAERFVVNNDTNADVYFFPFDNISYTDEVLIPGSDKAGNQGYLYNYFIWKGSLISVREDGWRIESIGDPVQPYGVPPLYRRWLWEEYNWNSGNTSWDLASYTDAVTYKTTHGTADSFIKGSTVSFDDALNSQIFTASEYHTTGVLNGVWNDNNEEWTFSADTTSVYPTKAVSGTTPSTVSLGNNSTPVRVFLSTTVNDGFEGTGADACRAGDPTNSGSYDNVAELVTDYWTGGLLSTTTSGSGSSSYQSYVEIRQKEYNPLYGSGFTFKPYVNSSSSSVQQTVSGGFRPASTTLLYSDGDAEAIYNYSMYPEISNIMVPGQSRSGATYNEITFGLTEQTFTGGTFPTGNNGVTYAFRLRWNDSSHVNEVTRNAPNYEWTKNKFIIEVIESGIVVNNVSTDEYSPNYLGSYGNYTYLDDTNKSTLEQNVPVSSFDFPDSHWVSTGITFRVKKESTAIKYYLNNTLVYTSLSTSSSPVAPANFFTIVGLTGTDNAVRATNAQGTLVLKYKMVKQDYWVRIGTSGNGDGSFDSNLLVIAGRLKESLGVTLDGTPVTWVADGYIGTLNAGECSLFPNDGYLRFSASDSGKTVAISNNARYLIYP